MIKRICLMLVLTGLASSCFADRDISGGVQKCYLRRVPHVTAQGKKLYEYSAAKSFLPLGLWVIRLDNVPDLPKAGFNTVALAGIQKLDLNDPQARKDMLKRLADNKVQLIANLVPKPEAIRALKDEKSLLSYMLLDEPNRFVGSAADPVGQVLEDIMKGNRLIHSIDPDRLTYVNLVPRHAFLGDVLQEGWWYAYNFASEIASTDCYEIISPESTVVELARSVKEQVEINQDDRPTWFIIQGHKDKRMPPHADNILPTPAQYRAEVYTAIVHGATGIIVFKMNEEYWVTHPGIGPDAHGDRGTPEEREKIKADRGGMAFSDEEAAQSRQLWALAGKINGELTGLKNVIFAPTSPVDYKIIMTNSQGGNNVDLPIRTLLKKVGDSYYLFASNIDNVKATVRIEMPVEMGKIADLKVIVNGDAASAKSEGSTIQDVFQSLDVRVYKFSMRK